MGYIFVDKEKESQGQMRDHMRHEMRYGNYRGSGNYRSYGNAPTMRDNYNEGYRQGYRHGWEDNEDDMNEEYRRQRDSRGRYV